jgi:MFS family permease
MGYFMCLGLAYILLQITSMQRFGLILGHPTYSVSIVMAGFLLSSGIGSIVSGRVPSARASQLLAMVSITLLLLAGAYHAFLSDITRWALLLAFPSRVLLTLGLIAPMGFVMGMCFPTGVRLLADRNEGLVAWAYGVNGAATVLGSVIAVWLAIGVGFIATQWLASCLYVVAALLMLAMARASATASHEASGIPRRD